MISPPLNMSLVAKGLFPDLGAPSLSYSRPQQGLPSRIGVWQEQKAPSQPPVNSTRRDLLQFTKRTLVTTGMPYASAKIRSQGWPLQTVPPMQQFFSPAWSLKVRHSEDPGESPRWSLRGWCSVRSHPGQKFSKDYSDHHSLWIARPPTQCPPSFFSLQTES